MLTGVYQGSEGSELQDAVLATTHMAQPRVGTHSGWDYPIFVGERLIGRDKWRARCQYPKNTQCLFDDCGLLMVCVSSCPCNKIIYLGPRGTERNTDEQSERFQFLKRWSGMFRHHLLELLAKRW